MARTAHAAASGVRCTAHAAGVERAVYVASSLSHRCVLHRCFGARCIGARFALHRRVLACSIDACCVGACCTLHVANAQLSAAHGRAVRCVVAGARELPDWAKAGLLRLPSGGAMHSCAGLRRRALHDQGHRAVRRRGDIRHHSKGASGASAAMRSWGGCRRTGCEGRLQRAWLRRLVRRFSAACCAFTMGP